MCFRRRLLMRGLGAWLLDHDAEAHGRRHDGPPTTGQGPRRSFTAAHVALRHTSLLPAAWQRDHHVRARPLGWRQGAVRAPQLREQRLRSWLCGAGTGRPATGGRRARTRSSVRELLGHQALPCGHTVVCHPRLTRCDCVPTLVASAALAARAHTAAVSAAAAAAPAVDVAGWNKTQREARLDALEVCVRPLVCPPAGTTPLPARSSRALRPRLPPTLARAASLAAALFFLRPSLRLLLTRDCCRLTLTLPGASSVCAEAGGGVV
jgi:hypothetical protein